MLLAGIFLAGVFVAIVFLKIDQFDKVTIKVTIDELALLLGILALWSGIMMWPYVRNSRLRTKQGATPTAARPPAERSNEPLSGQRGSPELWDEVAAGHLPGSREVADGSEARDEIHDQDLIERPAEPLGTEGDVSISDRPRSEVMPEGSTSEESASADSDVGVDSGRVAADLSVFRRSLKMTWHEYLQHGDGHFNAAGLKKHLAVTGIEARVRRGDAVKAGDNVLIVEDATRGTGQFFVVPSFTKSPRAALDWFEDASDGTLTRRTQKLSRLAEGRWTETGFVIVRKGTIA